MHYLVIAESRNAGPNSYGEGLAVVDPKSRQADRFAFESYPYENYGDHLCVALDDANPGPRQRDHSFPHIQRLHVPTRNPAGRGQSRR